MNNKNNNQNNKSPCFNFFMRSSFSSNLSSVTLLRRPSISPKPEIIVW